MSDVNFRIPNVKSSKLVIGLVGGGALVVVFACVAAWFGKDVAATVATILGGASMLSAGAVKVTETTQENKNQRLEKALEAGQEKPAAE